jgi:hypothetical protein
VRIAAGCLLYHDLFLLLEEQPCVICCHLLPDAFSCDACTAASAQPLVRTCCMMAAAAAAAGGGAAATRGALLLPTTTAAAAAAAATTTTLPHLLGLASAAVDAWFAEQKFPHGHHHDSDSALRRYFVAATQAAVRGVWNDDTWRAAPTPRDRASRAWIWARVLGGGWSTNEDLAKVTSSSQLLDPSRTTVAWLKRRIGLARIPLSADHNYHDYTKDPSFRNAIIAWAAEFDQLVAHLVALPVPPRAKRDEELAWSMFADSAFFAFAATLASPPPLAAAAPSGAPSATPAPPPRLAPSATLATSATPAPSPLFNS